jgi:DNA-binding response OmpR family regulator
MSSMNEKPLAFVIEDDKNLALAFAEAVREANFEVEVIYDGKTAMERLTSLTPTLVVLDIHIPHIKGSEILDFIRSTERLENIRVIVASADDQRAVKLRGIADLVLLKPIGFRQLQQLASRLGKDTSSGTIANEQVSKS